MTETTQEERDELRDDPHPQPEDVRRVCNDADRLAQIESVTCQWHRPDPEEEIFETACRSEWVMPDGITIDECPTLIFCSHCGRRIEVVGGDEDA